MLEIAGNYSTPHAGNLEFEEVLEMLEIPACCKNFATHAACAGRYRMLKT